MKKIFFIFIFSSFLFNVSFAEKVSDFYLSKKGSMDIHYKCIDDFDSSFTREFGIKKIRNNKFLFEYDVEDKLYFPRTALIEYKRKLKGKDVVLSFFYELIPPVQGLNPAIAVNILASLNNKKHTFDVWWIKNDKNSTIELDEEYWNFLDILENDPDAEIGEDLFKFTEKIHNIISKKLDFGEPFEIVDIADPSLDEFVKNPEGQPYNFPHTCKIKK